MTLICEPNEVAFSKKRFVVKAHVSAGSGVCREGSAHVRTPGMALKGKAAVERAASTKHIPGAPLANAPGILFFFYMPFEALCMAEGVI